MQKDSIEFDDNSLTREDLLLKIRQVEDENILFTLELHKFDE